MSQNLPPIPVTNDCNYIAAFLTMACPYRCSYCINEFASSRPHFTTMPGPAWVTALQRLTNLDRPAGPIPVTLQGGEPSAHPDFYHIINQTSDRIRLDILTNLAFDVEEMIRRVDPARLRRSAPYASIRVSYHPGQTPLDEAFAKTHRLIQAGFSVGIWAVLHPDHTDHILALQARALEQGIDFRTKEFLGFHHDRLHGSYKYPQACTMTHTQTVSCRTTELIIAPDGSVHRCHRDLYQHAQPIGSILDPDFRMTARLTHCPNFGSCNPCDIKVKTNRLQQFGHTSVEIVFPESPEPVSQTEPLQTARTT